MVAWREVEWKKERLWDRLLADATVRRSNRDDVTVGRTDGTMRESRPVNEQDPGFRVEGGRRA